MSLFTANGMNGGGGIETLTSTAPFEARLASLFIVVRLLPAIKAVNFSTEL